MAQVGRIILNVGGVRFETTRSTLSYSEYFNTRFQSDFADSGKDGEIFVDRSPDNFKYILEFLRNINMIQLPYKCALDLEFYMIPYEIPYLDENEVKNITVNGMPYEVSEEIYNFFSKKSIIIDEEKFQHIMDFLEKRIDFIHNYCIEDYVKLGGKRSDCRKIMYGYPLFVTESDESCPYEYLKCIFPPLQNTDYGYYSNDWTRNTILGDYIADESQKKILIDLIGNNDNIDITGHIRWNRKFCFDMTNEDIEFKRKYNLCTKNKICLGQIVDVKKGTCRHHK